MRDLGVHMNQFIHNKLHKFAWNKFLSVLYSNFGSCLKVPIVTALYIDHIWLPLSLKCYYIAMNFMFPVSNNKRTRI